MKIRASGEDTFSTVDVLVLSLILFAVKLKELPKHQKKELLLILLKKISKII